MNRFFRVLADPKATTRWFLKSPVGSDGEQLDSRIFTSGKIFSENLKLQLPLRRKGEPVDFNFCDFDMVVTPRQLNSAIQKIAGNTIQRIPIEIESSKEPYEILNTLDVVSCVDEEKSEFTKWGPNDGRPDKVGEYRMITKLHIDSEKAKEHVIFRINEWKVALIINSELKKIFEENKITGVVFQDVSLC